jgi:hypothetical protein
VGVKSHAGLIAMTGIDVADGLAMTTSMEEPKSGSWPTARQVICDGLQPAVGVQPGLRRSGG